MFSPKEIARLVDISAVRADSTAGDVKNIADAAKEYGFICAFAMPSLTGYLKQELAGADGIMLGGVVGFPSGSETTATKVFQAMELKATGCDEIDMVINIGMLKSGVEDEVIDDIRAVKAAVEPLPLKVIIEVALLTDEEIVRASRMVREAGADFVKTGTGWAGSTTMHHIEVIKNTVGDTIKLKVAGGVRDLDTLTRMKIAGVSRFGIGYKSALSIMEECIAGSKEKNK